ncbi:hypothetical protein FNN84_21760 [Salmonella enterica subsp. salamae]|uniref:Uncharacterized protein n=1 Tax=Salmonella enterica subsp. salamae TaxID=59202 RepID=A0A5Y2S971_SALER|nr:hypothetical protein [Salmonella enterica subsp. salamae]ECJ2314372.1 hypothetical protein [Salmonella enterica subsp. salamae]EDN4180245.1 hypothetical protein [Salmonella enterica subsp. salamae]
MKPIFIFFVLIMLNGCSFLCIKQEVLFSTDKLPTAIVGMAYHSRIQTTNSIISRIYVEDSKEYSINGLKIISSVTRNKFGDGEVIISGIPQKEGEFSFHVQGGTVGTQCPGNEFDAVFKIRVMNKK